jgi:DNA-binding response OmpR family regulator
MDRREGTRAPIEEVRAAASADLRAGPPVTRAELLCGVWGWDGETVATAYTRTLDSHASRLRRRLDSTRESFVHNCWGVGYRLTDAGAVPV